MRVDRQLLIDEARALLRGLGRGSMSPSAYDTAWVARLRDPGDRRRLLFPEAVAWLLAHQHADGAWGSRVETLHDRCISTLNCVVTLSELAAEGLLDGSDVRLRVSNAVAYLWRRAPDLQRDRYETVGFELLFPPLLDRARRLGIKLPYPEFDWVRRLREEKLQLVPPAMIYSRSTTLVHSLEFLAGTADLGALAALQAENGSFGNSPSATAYVLGQTSNAAALAYLCESMEATSGGGVCNVYPFELFEKAWVLENLQAAGVRLPEMEAHVRVLAEAWGDRGVGISASGLPADADDTALVLKVLRDAGYAVSADVFRHYEGPRGYVCFPFERNPSVSTNVHVLAAVKTERDRWAPEIRRILDFLVSTRQEGAYWRDKWHVSPYYATGHAIQALQGVEPHLCRTAVDWLLDTQRPDGAWGVFGGTCEETAYALQALMAVGSVHSPRLGPAIERGIEYLLHTRDTGPLPELWVGKGLYAPSAVVGSAILGALLQYAGRKGAVRA